jgi:oligoendopeptidase F
MPNKINSASKIKKEWDLSFFYKSLKDPQMEKDVLHIENEYQIFSDKYEKRDDYLNEENKLFQAMKDWDRLTEIAGTWKPLLYLHYLQDLDSTNAQVGSLSNKLNQRLTNSANKILFFNIKLGKISKSNQEKFLKSEKLKDYRYYLLTVFKNAKHQLSEAEEKIVNLKSLPAYVLWTQGQNKVLNKQTVRFGNKDIPLPEAYNKMSDLPTKKRRRLYDDVMVVLKGISEFAESELTAIYTDKKIEDELRGFKEPYSSSILQYENDEESVMKLVEIVTKNFNVSHKFYKLKAKMLKLPYLECVDKTASVGKIKKKIPFEKAIELTQKTLRSIDPKYEEIFNRFIKNGQIDFYPKKGKKGGAYCSSSIGTPTYVFLNHGDNTSGMRTIAHEMGHAFHSELSKTQKPIYQNYTMPVAEVASTFFENFMFEELLKGMTEKEKVIALHNRIQDSISTIFRQIAAFNWELELHRTVREKGAITKEEVASLHNKHMKAYLGPVFRWKELDGYTFVQWPHIRYYFYMYSYAYGQLISMALYRKYKENKSYLAQVEKFLSAGGSKSPEDIFKEIGIDTADPTFWMEGIREIESDIKKLEKLIK